MTVMLRCSILQALKVEIYSVAKRRRSGWIELTAEVSGR